MDMDIDMTDYTHHQAYTLPSDSPSPSKSNDSESLDHLKCCQAISMRYKCGHSINEYVRYKTDGTAERVELEPSIKFVQVPLNRLDDNYGRLNNDNYDNDISVPAPTTKPQEPDLFIHVHLHPLCGLFHITHRVSDISCESCYRREMAVTETRAVQAIEREIRKARQLRWSESSIEHLEFKLRAAVREREENQAFVKMIASCCFEDEGEIGEKM